MVCEVCGNTMANGITFPVAETAVCSNCVADAVLKYDSKYLYHVINKDKTVYSFARPFKPAVNKAETIDNAEIRRCTGQGCQWCSSYVAF